MSNWYVVISSIETGEEVKRMGPMSERESDKTLMAVIRQLDQERYCAATEQGAAA